MEKYPPAINVLTSMSYGGVKIYDHVHGDMTNRCNPFIRDHLQHLKEASKGNVQARAAAYSEMRDFLMSCALDGAEAYHDAGGMSYCHACKTQCPLIDSRTAELDRSKSDRAYVGVNAGTCCEDFARYGSCSGFAGERMHEYVLFIAELVLINPDWVFLEITDTCPPDLHQQAATALSMQMMSGIDRPNHKSFPNLRPRRFSFLWKPEVFDFLGSFAEYENITGRARRLTGNAYLFFGEYARQEYYRKFALSRGLHFDADATLTVDDFLTEIELERLKVHNDIRPMGEDAETRTYIVDMQQGPKYTSPGPCVPTLTKHSRLVSISDRGIKMWTPLEHLFSMGEAIKHGVGDPDYPCLFQDLLESGGLPPQEIVKMSGDAMHMASFGYFQLYCYSRLRSKD